VKVEEERKRNDRKEKGKRMKKKMSWRYFVKAEANWEGSIFS